MPTIMNGRKQRQVMKTPIRCTTARARSWSKWIGIGHIKASRSMRYYLWQDRKFPRVCQNPRCGKNFTSSRSTTKVCSDKNAGTRSGSKPNQPSGAVMTIQVHGTGTDQ